MDPSVYLALATVVTTVLLLVYIRLLHLRRLRRPPGPRPWPIVGNLPHLGKNPHLALKELSTKYGPVMFLKVGWVPTLVISSPEMAREFLVTQGELFSSRPTNLSATILSYNNQALAMCNNLQMVHLLRRICSIELLSTKRVKQFKDVRAEELMTTVQNIMEEGKDGQPVNDIVQKLIAVNNNNITRMVFKKRYCDLGSGMVAGDAREFQDLITNTVNLVSEFFPGNYFPYLAGFDFRGLKARMWQLRKRWDTFLEVIIKEHQYHRNEGESKETWEDFVDVLLSIRNKEKLTDEHIKGLMKDMIMGGTATTANQSAWGIVELVRNPDLQKKLQEELNTVVARDRLVSESDIPKLPYLQAFVNETFRLRTIIPILVPRQSINLKPVIVAGYEIPAKSQLLVNLYAIHMDPSIWEDPFKFDPERFLTKPIQVKGQDFEVLPFGSGRRSCPGMIMSILMVQMTVAHLAQSFEWSLPVGTDPAVLEHLGQSKTILGPKPIPLKISLRLPSVVYTTRS